MKKGTYKTSFSITIANELYEQLKQQAKKQNRSLSNYIETILEKESKK